MSDWCLVDKNIATIANNFVSEDLCLHFHHNHVDWSIQDAIWFSLMNRSESTSAHKSMQSSVEKGLCLSNTTYANIVEEIKTC